MSQLELTKDERFKDLRERVKHRFELVEIIEAGLTSMPSYEESIRVLEKYRVPVVPMLTVTEACSILT